QGYTLLNFSLFTTSSIFVLLSAIILLIIGLLNIKTASNPRSMMHHFFLKKQTGFLLNFMRYTTIPVIVMKIIVFEENKRIMTRRNRAKNRCIIFFCLPEIT